MDWEHVRQRSHRTCSVVERAEQRSGSDLVGPLSPRALGAAIDEVIADCVAAGLRDYEQRAVALFVRRHPVTRNAPTYRQAARIRVTVAVSIYLRLFAPPSDWTFVGAGISALGCRYDLVWRTPAGTYIVDELKAGSPRTVRRHPQRQLNSHVAGGIDKWGDDFGGVRLIFLAAPARSVFVDSTGKEEAIPLAGE